MPMLFYHLSPARTYQLHLRLSLTNHILYLCHTQNHDLWHVSYVQQPFQLSPVHTFKRLRMSEG